MNCDFCRKPYKFDEFHPDSDFITGPWWHPNCDCVKKYTKMLRKFGCKCPKPLLGYRPNVGPRCRLCNTLGKFEK